jgi:hypothetical protein
MEQNKTSKYFKYAIGEIILVVIGILIALQINNWNENQKQNNIKDAYLKSIEKELRTDVALIKKSISIQEVQMAKHKAIQDRITSKQATIDTLIKIGRFELDPIISQFDGFNNNTYNSLIASGQIELIDRAVKNDLFELNKLQEASVAQFRDNYTRYSEYTSIHLSEYPIDLYIVEINKGPIADYLWEHSDTRSFLTSYNRMATIRRDMYQFSLKKLKEALRQTELILNTYFGL